MSTLRDKLRTVLMRHGGRSLDTPEDFAVVLKAITEALEGPPEVQLLEILKDLDVDNALVGVYNIDTENDPSAPLEAAVLRWRRAGYPIPGKVNER